MLVQHLYRELICTSVGQTKSYGLQDSMWSDSEVCTLEIELNLTLEFSV